LLALLPLNHLRRGVVVVSATLVILPLLAMTLVFLTPLPNGAVALTWSYAPGLFLPSLGVLRAMLAWPPRVSWTITLATVVALFVLIALMPHADSLVTLERETGVTHPGLLGDDVAASWDLLARPVIFTLGLALIGSLLRPLLAGVADH
jgi:hypothetical protein